MRKIFLLSIIMIVSVYSSLSSAMPIPSEVKTIVVFIFVPNHEGKLIPKGTGFFVGVKNPTKPDAFFVYLVTAKHVLQKPDDKSLFPLVLIRLNTKEGDAKEVPLPLVADGLNKNVFVHEDNTVDLAVIPALPDQNKYEFKFLSDDFITTKEDFKKLKITEGSDIFFTGLFTPHIGEHRNYPIARFGKVALVTDEKIDWQGVKMELYLIESTSYGGNSGSPVFFYLGAEREPGSIMVGSPALKLAGVVKGYFGEDRPIKIIEAAKIPVVGANIGISAIVPAYKLHEILFGTELETRRKF